MNSYGPLVLTRIYKFGDTFDMFDYGDAVGPASATSAFAVLRLLPRYKVKMPLMHFETTGPGSSLSLLRARQRAPFSSGMSQQSKCMGSSVAIPLTSPTSSSPSATLPLALTACGTAFGTMPVPASTSSSPRTSPRPAQALHRMMQTELAQLASCRSFCRTTTAFW